jgi:hypothetical protein
MIAGYAGSSDKLDQALTRFDHVRAVRRGVLSMAQDGPEQDASAFRP